MRVLDVLPGLASLGVQGRLVPLPRGWLARRRAFRSLAADDLVVLHRRLLDPLLLRALRRSTRALALDLDDAIWTRPGGRSRRLEARFARALRAVDLVLVGSQALADEVHPRHARVRVVPPVPPRAPAAEPLPPDGLLHLAWTGSRPTLPYLEALAPALGELARARPGWVLDAVADAPPALPPGVPLRFHPWSLAREAAVLDAARVGLYPLPLDPWTRGKCAYKVRLYLRHGLAVATVPHGGGAEAAGPAGLLVPDPAGWLPALTRLVDEPALRERLAGAARTLARERDDPARRDALLATALREGAASRGFTPPGAVC